MSAIFTIQPDPDGMGGQVRLTKQIVFTPGMCILVKKGIFHPIPFRFAGDNSVAMLVTAFIKNPRNEVIIIEGNLESSEADPEGGYRVRITRAKFNHILDVIPCPEWATADSRDYLPAVVPAAEPDEPDEPGDPTVVNGGRRKNRCKTKKMRRRRHSRKN
jgi:hypothetical protein